MNGEFKIKILDDPSSEKLIKTAEKIVQFGWKTEAIPMTSSKKSLISRFFEAIFS